MLYVLFKEILTLKTKQQKHQNEKKEQQQEKKWK